MLSAISSHAGSWTVESGAYSTLYVSLSPSASVPDQKIVFFATIVWPVTTGVTCVTAGSFLLTVISLSTAVPLRIWNFTTPGGNGMVPSNGAAAIVVGGLVLTRKD